MSFFRYIKLYILILFIINILFVPVLSVSNNSNFEETSISGVSSNYGFIWPIPGYTNLSSYFGYRKSPTAGASSYHSGLDIPAPEGTDLYAIDDALITFASWGAGGGYTISMKLKNHPELSASYCHMSPLMYVSKGEEISKGTKIGTVGPKNIYGIYNNPYKDSNGNPTNGASTGCHLHFTIKKDNKAIDPLEFYTI